MTTKKADTKYINKETQNFLGVPFVFDYKNDGDISDRKGAIVELLYAPVWSDWIEAMYWTAFTTWDNGFEIDLNELQQGVIDPKQVTIDFLKKRPIAACLESAIFIFRLDNIPRTMTHQIVRHRGMAFNQESFRVSPAHHADIRIPEGLTKEQEEDCRLHSDLCRQLYKKLIKEGVPIEQARNMMPMGTCTHLTMMTNLKALQDYIKARIMDTAQDEHTYIVARILEQLKKEAPEFYGYFIQTDKTEEIMKTYLQ